MGFLCSRAHGLRNIGKVKIKCCKLILMERKVDLDTEIVSILSSSTNVNSSVLLNCDFYEFFNCTPFEYHWNFYCYNFIIESYDDS